jgi:hypothetical protein
VYFDNYPEFIDNDVRKNREYLTVTSESLSKRCSVIVPEHLIKNKTVLDLGSALGAMGHYCLHHGASSYTGVEIQKNYRDKSIELLGNYNSSFEIFNSIESVRGTYDVVLACGFVHGFFDVFDILRRVCSLSNKYVIIETHNPQFGESPVISFNLTGNMVKNDGRYDVFRGVETVTNRHAIDLIMAVNGFSVDERLYPEKIETSHDGYNSETNYSRFICRYIKGGTVNTLEDAINVGF